MPYRERNNGDPQKFESRPSKPLKVIGTDTDRSATYDGMLVFRSNYDPISYRLRDNGRYL